MASIIKASDLPPADAERQVAKWAVRDSNP
jgi:hypothetical protein